VVTQDLVLTSNEYWIFGEWINANVYILEPNTTIYSWAPMGNGENGAYVSNWSPVTGYYTEAHGLRLYAFTYADVDIRGIEDVFTLQNIVIYVANTYESGIYYASGDVYIQGAYIWLMNLLLRNAYVVAWAYLALSRVKGNNGTWVIISYSATYVENCSFDGVLVAYLNLTTTMGTVLSPNLRMEMPLISIDDPTGSAYISYRIKSISPFLGSANVYGVYLPQGVTWSIDTTNKTITVANNTSDTVNIYIEYQVEIILG
jgi:hypothetical protein